MMYGYGAGGWWMMLMPLLWIALVAVIVWAAVGLIRPDSRGRTPTYRETPLEILDRRYAQGEIDDAIYTAARTHLIGRAPITP